MSQITTTNRQAILALIAAADETTEVNSIESRLESLEDFISVDVPSGVATFSASQSITSTVTDGDKYGQVSIENSFISILIDDTAQDQTPSISVSKTFGIGGVPNTSEIIFNTIDNTGNGGEAVLSVKSERDIGSSVNLTAEYINNTAGSIVSTVTDETNTSSISMYPDSMDILATDGTVNVSCGVYTTGFQLTSTDNSSFNNNISINAGDTPGLSIGSANPSSSAATSIEFRSDSISLLGLPSFDDDADAAAGSLVAGNLYQTTGLGASPLDVAGILMIKQ